MKPESLSLGSFLLSLTPMELPNLLCLVEVEPVLHTHLAVLGGHGIQQRFQLLQQNMDHLLNNPTGLICA